MNRALKPLLKSLAVVLTVTAATTAFANEAKAPAPKADPAKGATLYTSGDAARGIVACMSCHGDAGNSTISANPKLAGQHETYLAKQLKEFTGAERNNAVMTAMAKSLSADDVNNIAAYLSGQKQKPGTAKNKDIVMAGKQIYRAGIPEKNVPACAGCHSPNGAGMPAQFPRLAGQHQDYTIAQLSGFANGSRKNSAQMTTISKKMSKEEIDAVADYIAGLK